MKKLYILITFLFLTTSYLSAQTDAVTGLTNPSRMFLVGTTMYIADANTVYTADISSLPVALPDHPVNSKFASGVAVISSWVSIG